jgi:hypothetical protein
MSTFDYTSRDYASIQSDLLRRAQTTIPEWTNREPSDFGMVMVDLWAYMGDILHYYVDRAAQEAFLQTATQRESVLAIANLLDYVPAGRFPAVASVTLNATLTAATDTSPIYIPKNTRFLARPLLDTASPVVFTLDSPIAFVGTTAGASANITYNGVVYNTYSKTAPVTVAVTEGEVFTETYSSTGLAGQQITLRNTGVVTESISISVNEGPAGGAVQYTYVPRLISANNTDRVFSADITADNYSVVTFGNAVNGRIPLINSTITVTYRRSRGAAGNVLQNAINRFETTTLVNLPSLDGISVTSSTNAIGGVDIESITSLKANIPASFRAQDRAVSLQDYMDIVKRVPGIVKSTAWVDGSNVVQIRAASTPSSYATATSLVLTSAQITSIEEYLSPREIAYVSSNVGASLELTPVNVGASVQVLPGYVQQVVRDNVDTAIRDLFSFDNVEVDTPVSLGSLYRAALSVEGVDYFTVGRFTKTGSPGVIDSSGGFIGVTPDAHEMLAIVTGSSSFTITASGGVVATIGS